MKRRGLLLLAPLGLVACQIYLNIGSYVETSAGATGAPSGNGATSGSSTTAGTGGTSTTTGTGGTGGCGGPGATASCYDGPPGTLGQGTCRGGTKTCGADGVTWGPCTGEVLPPCKPNVLWAKRFGDSDDQRATSVAVDGAGNVLVTGSFKGTADFGGNVLTSAGQDDIFIAKLDPKGNHIWSQAFGDSADQSGSGIAVDATGDVLVTGSFSGSVAFGGACAPLAGVGTYDFFVAKLDPNGNCIWSKGFGSAGNTQQAGAVIAGSTGAAIVTGGFRGSINLGGGTLSTPGPGSSIFLAAFDPTAGNHLWSHAYGPGGGQALALDAAGNVLVSGVVTGVANFCGAAIVCSGIADIFAAKLDGSGNCSWSKGLGNAGAQNGKGVAVDSASKVLLTGLISGAVDFGGDAGSLQASPTGDSFMAKLNPDGSFLAGKDFGRGAGSGVAVDASGNAVLAGSFNGSVNFGGGPLASATSGSIFVAKYDPGGAYVWAAGFGQGGIQGTMGVAVDSMGDSFITGYFHGSLSFGSTTLDSTGGTAGGTDIFLAKLSP